MGLGRLSFFRHCSDFSILVLTNNILSRKTSLKKYYNIWGLEGTKKQGHTLESIDVPIQTIRAQYPNIGAPEVRHLLRTQAGIKVPKYVLVTSLKLVVINYSYPKSTSVTISEHHRARCSSST